MKKAFTMIELIFVIVILGILAAVALPRFVGVASQAREGNLKSFVGTLNRTVGPSLWSKAMSNGNDGDISSLTGDEGKLSTYTDIPNEVTNYKVSDCNDTSNYRVIAIAPSTKVGGDFNYYIICRNGTASESPRFVLIKRATSQTAHSLGDTNDSNDTIVQ